jgi:hypothetical protein
MGPQSPCAVMTEGPEYLIRRTISSPSLQAGDERKLNTSKMLNHYRSFIIIRLVLRLHYNDATQNCHSEEQSFRVEQKQRMGTRLDRAHMLLMPSAIVLAHEQIADSSHF